MKVTLVSNKGNPINPLECSLPRFSSRFQIQDGNHIDIQVVASFGTTRENPIPDFRVESGWVPPSFDIKATLIDSLAFTEIFERWYEVQSEAALGPDRRIATTLTHEEYQSLMFSLRDECESLLDREFTVSAEILLRTMIKIETAWHQAKDKSCL